MKIGLIDVDGHAKKKKWGAKVYPNIALAKISAYHKAKGDQVEWYEPMFSGHCDRVYMAKVFNFSPDYIYPIDADEIVKGGTGYSITYKLQQYIDDMQPDFSIYPNVPTDTSYGFLTRGCPNKCQWCVVPKKEGAIQPYWDIERVANGKKKVVLMDNNILAAGDYCTEQLDKIIKLCLKVDFNQALDARLVNEDNARQLAKIKWLDNRIRFGCDTHKQIDDCERAMDLINGNGYKGQYFLYTMLQGDIDECYERINHWKKKNELYRNQKIGNAVFPYAQPYRNPFLLAPPPIGNEKWRGGATQNHSYTLSTSSSMIPQWQKDMERWTNKHQLFWSLDFKDFEPRIVFKCKQYFEK